MKELRWSVWEAKREEEKREERLSNKTNNKIVFFDSQLEAKKWAMNNIKWIRVWSIKNIHHHSSKILSLIYLERYLMIIVEIFKFFRQ